VPRARFACHRQRQRPGRRDDQGHRQQPDDHRPCDQPEGADARCQQQRREQQRGCQRQPPRCGGQPDGEPRQRAAQARALADLAADKAGIRGNAVTPFLLGFIVEASGGRSLEVNLDLARNNIRVAGDIAIAWSRLSA
jgi:hypothetical protein